jgi:glycosyltransferase involved in cell wall biosynthesis
VPSPLNIIIAGPPSKNLLEVSVRDADRNPIQISFPLIDQIAHGYCELGHRVTYVTTNEHAREKLLFPGRHPKLTVICLPRRRIQWCMLDLYRKEIGLIRKTIRECEPDVVHAMWSYEYADAALGSSVPTLVTAHDSPWRIAWLLKRPLRIERAFYSQFWVLPRTRHLSTVSPYMIHALRNHHFYRRPIELIPNGIPLSEFAAQPRIGVRSMQAPVIAGVSEWYPLKNPKILLDSFKIVQQEISGARLMLFGHGFQTGGPADIYAQSIGLLSGVSFFGHCSPEKIREILRNQADVFLHTTLEESFGMTFIEAMSLGIPCVGGFASGAIPWVLDHGNAGVLVDVKRAQVVADAVLRIVWDTEDYKRIARNGYFHAKKCFAMEDVVMRYEKCLLNLLK